MYLFFYSPFLPIGWEDSFDPVEDDKPLENARGTR
jgi:hypothetical protein